MKSNRKNLNINSWEFFLLSLEYCIDDASPPFFCSILFIDCFLFTPLIMYYEKSFNDNKIPIIPRPSLHTQLHQAVGDTNIKYNARCHSVHILWHREVSWLIFDRTDVCKRNILPKCTIGRCSLHSWVEPLPHTYLVEIRNTGGCPTVHKQGCILANTRLGAAMEGNGK